MRWFVHNRVMSFGLFAGEIDQFYSFQLSVADSERKKKLACLTLTHLNLNIANVWRGLVNV